MMAGPVDVVIITAAEGEDTALREVLDGALSGWTEVPPPQGYPVEVFLAEYQSLSAPGTPVRIVTSRPSRLGGDDAASAAGHLIAAFQPRCIAMCGVCAGRPEWTQLGDVIIAERVWRYDTGERHDAIRGGRPSFKQDMELFRLSPTWLRAAKNVANQWTTWPGSDKSWLEARPRPLELQALWLMRQLAEGQDPTAHPDVDQLCSDWPDVVEQLARDGLVVNGELTETGHKHLKGVLFKHRGRLPEQPAWAVHVGPLATGNHLIRDVDVWRQLEDEPRLVRGFDMELATVGQAGWASEIPFLAVKGVMDYGLAERHRGFRKFAARAAAEVLVRFLRTLVPGVLGNRTSVPRWQVGGHPDGDEPRVRLERLEIKNYRLFRHVVFHQLPELVVLVGANGSGKSTLLDVFGLLRDALQSNVHAALDERGGFHEVRSREQEGPISFELDFRTGASEVLVTYKLEIGENEGRAVILHERLEMRPRGARSPLSILDFKLGFGSARTVDPDEATSDDATFFTSHALDSPDILALKGLGQFRGVSIIRQLRRLIEGWRLFDLHVPLARPSQEAGSSLHLSPHGENLSQVTRHLYENHRELFGSLLEHMKRRVPGVASVEATGTADNRVVLRFRDQAFKDPFLARNVSDGTLAMFAYLVLLYDPSPHPLLCIEEPEHHLYHALMPELLEELRDYGRRGGQVMVSTHSPDLLNAAKLEEIYWLEKRGGFSTVHRASDDEQLRALVEEGDLPGALWKQGLLGGVDP